MTVRVQGRDGVLAACAAIGLAEIPWALGDLRGADVIARIADVAGPIGDRLAAREVDPLLMCGADGLAHHLAAKRDYCPPATRSPEEVIDKPGC